MVSVIPTSPEQARQQVIASADGVAAVIAFLTSRPEVPGGERLDNIEYLAQVERILRKVKV